MRRGMTKCTACRIRHLTCDQNATCSECANGDRECIRGYNLRFRNLTCPSRKPSRADYGKFEFFFDREQTWLSTNAKLEFVSEAIDILNTSQRDGLEGESGPGLVSESNRLESIPAGQQTLREEAPAPVDDSTAYLDNGEVFNQPPLSKIDILATESLVEASLSGETLRSESRLSYPETPASAAEPLWPLRDLQEGRLLRHFITHLAPWFDMGDSKRHFSRYVPCMAASSPLLMTAILALAALHQSRVIGDGDMCEAMDYHDRCLNMLVPMLSNSNLMDDDSVLITTVILHLYEDLDSGNDSIRHIKGTSIFYPSEGTGESSQLRRAVFWIHLDQEIYNAYIHQRSVRPDFSLRDIESYTEDQGDDMWVHKTMYIAAFVSKWAFGENSTQSRWRELCQMLDDWQAKRPSSFDPVYFRPRDSRQGRFFPEVCYVTDASVAASQLFYMAKLLLVTHDPGIPRIGPRMKSVAAAVQETSLSYVRTMVGSAICNSFVPARFVGSLAIIICGSWFTNRQEQQALLDFMRETDRCSGWPREHAQQALMDEWGWEKEER